MNGLNTDGKKRGGFRKVVLRIKASGDLKVGCSVVFAADYPWVRRFFLLI